MSRETVTLTPKISEQIERYARLWDVSKAEAMRRLFAYGLFIAETQDKDQEIYVKEDNGEQAKIIFKTG